MLLITLFPLERSSQIVEVVVHIFFKCFLESSLTPFSRYRTAALALVLTLCSHPAVLSQQNTNSISGHVSDSQRSPVPNLRVELLNEVDSVIQTVKTDGSGLFIFRKLSDGSFQVRVQTGGTNYVSQTKRVELTRPHGFGAAFEEIEFVLTTNRATGPTGKSGVIFAQDVPDQARKLYQKASDLLDKPNKRPEAFATLKNALEIYPQYFDALELLGSEQVKDRQYEPAIPVLTKALE